LENSINELLKEKELKISKAVSQALFENLDTVFYPEKEAIQYKFDEIERERAKVIRRK
jgi:hypothetical protein